MFGQKGSPLYLKVLSERSSVQRIYVLRELAMDVSVHRIEGWKTEVEFRWSGGHCKVPVFLEERVVSMSVPAAVRTFFTRSVQGALRERLLTRIAEAMGDELDDLRFLDQ